MPRVIGFWNVFAVFFFSLAPCRRPTGLLLPLTFAGAGAKKQTPDVVLFFFCSGPAERSRRPTGRSKKKHFAHPGTTAKKILETNDTGHEQKGATTNNKKKPTHSLRPWTATLTHFFSGATFPAVSGWCFFFCCGPARTLTHSLRVWAAMPPAGVVLFVLLRPRLDRGGDFFCCGPARTLTHSLWAGAISARPGSCFFVYFFLLRPGRSRRANNKKCLVYYIGSKTTLRGHSKKKHFPIIIIITTWPWP